MWMSPNIRAYQSGSAICMRNFLLFQPRIKPGVFVRYMCVEKYILR